MARSPRTSSSTTDESISLKAHLKARASAPCLNEVVNGKVVKQRRVVVRPRERK